MLSLRNYEPSDWVKVRQIAESVQLNLGRITLVFHTEWQIAIDAPDKLGDGARAYIHHPNVIRMHILVYPNEQGRGIGSTLYERSPARVGIACGFRQSGILLPMSTT